MINVEEIRINNYIKPVGDFPYWKVTSKDILYLEKNPSEYEFIPLTEEWLIKFGFEKRGFGRVHDMEFVGYRLGIYDVYVIENGEFVLYNNNTEKSIANVKYVHRFQNLYYELKSKELTIQLINSDIKK